LSFELKEKELTKNGGERKREALYREASSTKK